jgi:hypothetical protein
MGKEPDYKILVGTVLSVSEHKNQPYTIEFRNDSLDGQKFDVLTVDPRCTFYKDDPIPKTLAVVKPFDVIEATYIVWDGGKVAFNIIVKPKVPMA